MRFRKLRIAWSVWFAIACVLLIVLWVRSYWWQDTALWYWGKSFTVIGSRKGSVGIVQSVSRFTRGTSWRTSSVSIPANDTLSGVMLDPSVHGESGFRWRILGNGRDIEAPFWFPVLMFGVFATAPLVSWSRRFSLRTLLIATTLIAAVLGLIVWLVR